MKELKMNKSMVGCNVGVLIGLGLTLARII
jgi:hypothetical protein